MHVASVNIFVADLARAVEFHRDTFGLAPQFSSPEHGFASFSAGAVRLGIAVPGPADAGRTGRHGGVGFEVADLEAAHARRSALGVQFPMPPTRQPWGGFMALVADPDGNVHYVDQVAQGRR